MFRLTILLLAVQSASPLAAESLRLLAWNVESGGNNPETIASELRELSGYDIVGLSELRGLPADLTF